MQQLCNLKYHVPSTCLPAGSNLLNAKNDKPLRAGQVVAVTLGVTGLEAPDAADARDKVYALQVCGSVVVGWKRVGRGCDVG